VQNLVEWCMSDSPEVRPTVQAVESAASGEMSSGKSTQLILGDTLIPLPIRFSDATAAPDVALLGESGADKDLTLNLIGGLEIRE
jgi:hypothetical protein